MINRFLLFNFLMLIALFLHSQGASDSLKTYYYSSEQDMEKKASTAAEIAASFQRINPDSAKHYAKEGMNISDSHSLADAYLANACQLGKAAIIDENLEEAIRIFQEAYTRMDQLEDRKSALCLLLLMGYVYDNLGDYLNGHIYYYEGLKISEELQDSVFLWSYCNNLGIHYQLIGDYTASIEMLKTALSIFQNLKEDAKVYSLASVYNNLGLAYMEVGMLDSASHLLRKALMFPELETNYYGQYNININLCEIALEKDNYLLTEMYLEKARIALDSLRITFTGTMTPLVSKYNNLMAKFFFSKGNFEQAQAYSMKVLDTADIFKGDLIFQSESFERLASIYENRGKHDLALAYYKRFKQIKDTLEARKSNQEITRISLSYAHEKEITKNQIQMELMEVRNKRKESLYIFILITAGGILISLILLFLLQRNKARQKSLEEKAIRLEKEKLNNQLEYKDKELTTNVLYLLRKNELIVSITKKLAGLLKNLDEKDSRIIQDIINELDRSTSKDTWEEFEMRFKEVHTDFYNRLSLHFPNLTTQEFRLCAFLRLNMTNKEIAAITYQSPESLKAARYRLRKKLGLSREDNLVAFLTKIR